MFKKAFKYPAIAVTILLALLMLIGCASAWIKPSTTMIPTYLGIAFPFLALLNIAVALLWMIRKDWMMLVPIITLMVCGHNLQKTIGLHGQLNKEELRKTDLKVLTYNVKLFNFYDKKDKVLDYILGKDADIVCLQEFGYHTGDVKFFLSREDIMGKMRKTYPYHHFSMSDIYTDRTYGVATFSKYPIVKHNEIPIVSRFNSVIYSDLKIGEDTLRVVNLHLESDRLTEAEKDSLQHISTSKESNNNVILVNQKLTEAYDLRENQAEVIGRFVEKSKHPVLLCGDTNDVPVSYTYNKLSGNRLTDAFTERGTGYSSTFSQKFIRFRIDEVMHSDELEATSYQREKVTYSDHYPVIVGLKWTK